MVPKQYQVRLKVIWLFVFWFNNSSCQISSNIKSIFFSIKALNCLKNCLSESGFFSENITHYTLLQKILHINMKYEVQIKEHHIVAKQLMTVHYVLCMF